MPAKHLPSPKKNTSSQKKKRVVGGYVGVWGGGGGGWKCVYKGLKREAMSGCARPA